MFALHSDRLRRRLSAPSSGSARRRARERRHAELTRLEGECLARERAELAAWEKYESQHRARRELATYEPWGRGGGGAPNPRGIRFTNIRDEEIIPENELKGVQVRDLHDGWATSPQRRGRRRYRGTPLRLREDPQLYFAENLRRSVENDIRYRRTPGEQKKYKQILDEMVEQRYKAVEAEIKRDLEEEKKLVAMEKPWGKPGPGGTTWREPRDIGLNFSKSMGWTDNEILNKIQGRDKGSSLTLPKVKKDDDSYEKYLYDKENNSLIAGKLPDIAPGSGMARPPSIRNEEVPMRTSPVYKLRGKKSPKKTKFAKHLISDTDPKLVYPEDLYEPPVQNVAVDNVEKKVTPEKAILRLTGGVELVPLLARRRRVGPRTLPSSDVTRPPEQDCQWREISNGEYLRVLKNQMMVKNRQKEESRVDSAESVRRHHATWASLWGRPGHGAPQDRGRYARSNLARLLYVKPLYE